jgi:tRNA-dihydrouridine synthase A
MRRISVAPMMEITDRHQRWLARQLAPSAWLFTEMITTWALIHGDAPAFLEHDPAEDPVALQLGGDDPAALARCAKMAEDAGYAEVNLNVGCPSERVQSGSFGVCLMAHPERVADAVAAMRAVVRVPVTVKHRIGFDDLDRYEDMLRFVDVVASAGCDHLYVHARKAWLKGLSPKDNRTIPPLRHDEVHRLKRERPHLAISTNGGVRTVEEARAHLQHVDGVMIGRAAAEDPLLLAALERDVLGTAGWSVSALEIAERVLERAEREVARGVPGPRVVRHVLPLLHGRPGARAWRRRLSEGDRGVVALREAIAALRPELSAASSGDEGGVHEVGA